MLKCRICRHDECQGENGCFNDMDVFQSENLKKQRTDSAKYINNKHIRTGIALKSAGDKYVSEYKSVILHSTHITY